MLEGVAVCGGGMAWRDRAGGRGKCMCIVYGPCGGARSKGQGQESRSRRAMEGPRSGGRSGASIGDRASNSGYRTLNIEHRTVDIER